MHTCQDLSQCPLPAKQCAGIERQDNSAWLSASVNIDSKAAHRG